MAPNQPQNENPKDNYSMTTRRLKNSALTPVTSD